MSPIDEKKKEERRKHRKTKFRIVKVKWGRYARHRTLKEREEERVSEIDGIFPVSLLPNHFGQIYLIIKIGVAARNMYKVVCAIWCLVFFCSLLISLALSKNTTTIAKRI